MGANKIAAPFWRERWAQIGALLALIGGVFGILDLIPRLLSDYERAWTLRFIPDILVTYGALLVAIGAYHKWGRTLMASCYNILFRGKIWQKAVITGLILALVVVAAYTVVELPRYYRVRLFSAKFDWHYANAKIALRNGDYQRALNEFKSQRDRFTYLPEETAARGRRNMMHDTNRRLSDVDNYLHRFKAETDAVRGIDFQDILLLQRASQLLPGSNEVLRLAKLANGKLDLALQSYFRAIALMQNSKFIEARKELKSSRQYMRLLDQDLLIRYCELAEPEALSLEEREIIEFYLQTPIPEMEAILHEHPLLEAVAKIGPKRPQSE